MTDSDRTHVVTGLHDAISANDLAGTTALLVSGADPNSKDLLGYPPLAIAAALGESQIVELLLNAGADPLLLDTRMGASALHKAAQSGVVDVARLLLERGAFVDQQAPTHGHTPLIDASWHKRSAMVRFLLEHGANPNIRAHGGYDAATLLSEAEVLAEIRETVAEHRERRRQQDKAPLRLAALHGDLEGVRRAVAHGADVNERAVDGHTPLLDAAREGYAEVVAELLTSGADPLIVDHLMKATPAHKAAYMGHADVARLLAANGVVDLDAQGPYNGFTALHDAIWHGSTDAAVALVECGARQDLAGLDGRTAFQMANEYDYPELAAQLAAHLPDGDERGVPTAGSS